MTRRACPACEHPGLAPFYRCGPVPVHSTLLMRTRDEARKYPRAELELAWCRQCGFISNAVFDSSAQAYSAQCEESQGCSPTFSAWQQALAQRLADRHGFHGRTILEIGCGKGEFLADLCAAGENRGIGYDPAYVPGRLGARAREIDFKTKFWNRACGLDGADAVVCRHTLEHIPGVLAFLRDLRAAIGPRRDVPVFFEVPDTGRVLREGAFWDVYYEHCSYFRMDNLRALFTRAGFEVLESWLDYEDQYLMVVAQPSVAPKRATPPSDDPGAEVSTFVRASKTSRALWASRLESWDRGGLEVVLWGGGSKAVAFLSSIEHAGVIRRVVDINPRKQGGFIPGGGQVVVAPEDLARHPAHKIILMNPVYREEVGAQVVRLGCQAELLVLGNDPRAAQKANGAP
ncbi:MAG: class I SAM-dependent methyltransferase [Xanthomonadales bacterium]|nr:class I SAM-dependent methyltransferase [Xanthomonadales bacterium]